MIFQNFLGFELSSCLRVPPKKRCLASSTACLQRLEWFKSLSQEVVLLCFFALEKSHFLVLRRPFRYLENHGFCVLDGILSLGTNRFISSKSLSLIRVQLSSTDLRLKES